MSIQDVVVSRREKLGKGETGRLRKTGVIPGVVYGMGGETISVSVIPKSIGRVIKSDKGLNTVINLSLEGTDQSRHVMIKDLNRHPVSDRLTHVDFMRIDMNKSVSATIPLRFTGSPEGVKLGGILTIVRHEVEIDCLPSNLMGEITVDVTSLGLDEALRIGDLPQPEGVVYKLEASRTVAVVHAEKHAVLDEETDAAAAEVAAGTAGAA